MTPDGFDLAAFKKPGPRPVQRESAENSAGAVAPEVALPDAVPLAPRQPERDGGASTPAPVRRRRAPRAAAPTSDGRLVVALPVGLRDRAKAVAATRGETYAEVVLRAIQETHPRLGDLVASHRGGDGPAIGSLFEHRAKPKRVAEATVQVTIRGLSQHDRGVLDRLVDEVGAANLTELVTVALDEHLPARPRAMR